MEEVSWRSFLIGQSPAIQQLGEVIKLVAPKRVTVLISGETGTGKEVVARAIHAASPRANFPMVAVNCTALPLTLAESELFGHSKGAFTGAHITRVGRFEQANRSSIFLDEIGDLPLEAQAKLLRVLQEQEFERVGSSETVRIDVRVIAASNVDLENAVRERRFREDLFYRLNVVPIHLVPLRERKEDIPLLLDYFLEKTRIAEASSPKQIADDALDFLMKQNWPGNVRQLEHAVQMAFALSGDRSLLEPRDFRVRSKESQAVSVPGGAIEEQPLVTVGREGLDFDSVVSSFERSLLNQALAVAGGNKARAADLLRIKRTTLLAKIKTLEEQAIPHGPGPVCGKTSSLNSGQTSALVVASELPVRKLIANTLEQEGYRPLFATGMSTALELLECWKEQIKLLIVSSGRHSVAVRDLSARVHQQNPHVPTILIGDANETGSSVNPQTANWVWLLQPFSSEELAGAIQRLSSAVNRGVAGALCA